MSRLPTPGGDDGTWGAVLNDFLGVEHNVDGTLKKAADIADAKIKADSAVQTVNGKSGTSITLAAGDVGAIAGVKQTSAPSSPATNDLWYDSTNDLWKRWNGSTWIAAGVSQSDLTAQTSRAAASYQVPITTPSGFSWSSHPLVGKLFVDQHGIFTSTLDPTTLKAPAGVTYYCDVVAGNNANNGLTAGTAFKSLSTAVAQSDVGTVMVNGYGPANPYSRTNGGMNGTAITKPINIIGYGSDVPYITTHDVPSWTLAAGMTNTYQTTRSSVSRVVDMINAANNTEGVEYVNVATEALVESTPGSWSQSGSICYVHTPTNRVPDAYVWPLLAVVNLRNTGDFTTYLENVKFFGGSECIRSAGATSTGGLLVCNNVEARYSQTGVGNNIAINGSNAIMVNSDWSYSGMDGAGYHSLNGKAPQVVEIGCRGVSCGHSSTDQCSTIHDGGTIIRVACTYRNGAGAVIADVNDNTQSWNLGVVADNGAAGYSFKFGNDSGTVKAWLHDCAGINSKWGAFAYGTAQVLTRGSRFDRTNVTLTSY